MTTPTVQPISDASLIRSGIYEVPLRLTEAQAHFLQTQYPINHSVQYFHFPLDRVQVRQVIWADSLLFSSLIPSGLAIELSELPELAQAALARYTLDEAIPAAWPSDAPARAWLVPDSTYIVARPNGSYKAEFAFRSTRPMFHFGHAAARALMLQVDAEVEAERLADELMRVRTELHEVQQRLAIYETHDRWDFGPSFASPIKTRRERCSSRRPVGRSESDDPI